MPQLQVVAHHTLAAGKEEETLALYPALAKASRAEPGNVFFTVFRQLDNPREVLIYERYASREAFDAHRETPHFKDLVLGRILPLLDNRVLEQFDVPE
ncbi:putative quinol monooxygenase [Streptomyces sp. NPDC093675]|uniref:putative quinol monooxygenase n=1 Tax=Streptomyces sp. NPDC093675 TaxID=3366049 RepID=UPI0038066FFE